MTAEFNHRTSTASARRAMTGLRGDAPIYMDHNASTPTHDSALAAMTPLLAAGYGNPSSGHWASAPAAEAIERARGRVAGLIGADPAEIIFTSGATEANNTAIKGFVPHRDLAGQHIITSAIEHDAVLRPVRALRLLGVKVTVVPVDGTGIIDPDAVRKAITPRTGLISIMMANNEVGTLQPVAEIGAIAQAHGIAFHSDAAQAAGKVAIDVDRLGVDMLSLAGHKFGAPIGIGALFVRKGAAVTPLLHGAGHERGRRAGTESALLAAGLGAAAKHAMQCDSGRIGALRDYFWNSLVQSFGERVALNGHLYKRVPNTLSVSFPGFAGAEILAQMPHVAATTGSACHAGCADMSPVLIAMGKSRKIGLGAIRFSLGETNTIAEIDHVVGALRKIIV